MATARRRGNDDVATRTGQKGLDKRNDHDQTIARHEAEAPGNHQNLRGLRMIFLPGNYSSFRHLELNTADICYAKVEAGGAVVRDGKHIQPFA